MRTKIIALMVIMAAQAHAQTLLSYTNVRADVSGGPAFSSSAVAGSFRFTYVVEDTPGVPLNLDDGTTFRLEAWAADGVRAHNVASTNLVSTDLSSGQVRFVVPSIGVGEYRIRGVAQPAGGDTTLVWQITHHMLTVTSAPSAGGGGSVSVNVVLTNDTDMAELVAIGQPSGLVAVTKGDGSTDLLPYGGGSSSGGGDSSVINGERPTNLVFNASYPFTLTKTTNEQGMVLTYGLSGTAGTIVIPSGNTSTSHFYYVSTNAQFYTAGPTATQLLIFAVGSAAGFSAGGVGFRYVPCTGSQVFACYVPEGGEARTNGVARGGWGYVPGGDATSTNGVLAVSGAGSLAVLSGTNVVLHLGAAGGGASYFGRANGGGLVGFSLGTASSGSGGTQTNHGAGASGNTNSIAGSSINGGHGITLGGGSPGSGGGGGYYSGGGGCGSASVNNNSGGAGSTLIYEGITSRSAPDSASPPSTDNALYKAPYGVGIGTGTAITNFNRGNPGLIAILSYPES